MTTNYCVKKTIRYMGNKNKLLDFIIPEIEAITKKGDVICDLMCGTCAVSYALKNKYTVYSNDIQYYSYIIAKGLIENNCSTINSTDAKIKLEKFFLYNQSKKEYAFFYHNYKDTYFSEEQCLEIDSIRYAINQETNDEKKSLYLTTLMYAMSKCESTSGHFAQYLPKDHLRLSEIRKKSIWEEFLKKCDDFSDIIMAKYGNKAYNMDYKDLINHEDFKKVDCVYIDTPYTGEQYSRFYHILETVTKYDNPSLEYKGLYRTDRYMSDFSLKTNVKNEFDYLISNLAKQNKKMVLSYSNKGLIEIDLLKYIVQKYYKKVFLKEIKYAHSTQGKGVINLNEIIIVAYN